MVIAGYRRPNNAGQLCTTIRQPLFCVTSWVQTRERAILSSVRSEIDTTHRYDLAVCFFGSSQQRSGQNFVAVDFLVVRAFFSEWVATHALPDGSGIVMIFDDIIVDEFVTYERMHKTWNRPVSLSFPPEPRTPMAQHKEARSILPNTRVRHWLLVRFAYSWGPQWQRQQERRLAVFKV